MTTSSAIMIPEASALLVDTSCIDVSEVENQADKVFLLEKGENILRIVAKAALEVGRELVVIQERFQTEDNPQGHGLTAYYSSLGIESHKATQWANKWRAFNAYVELFGDDSASEKINELADTAATRLWNLPQEYREAFLADIAVGETPTIAKLTEVSKDPEVKLSKAEELLEAAKARKEKADEKWERVKADPDIDSNEQEYLSANSNQKSCSLSVEKYEQQIADLQAQIEEEKLKTAEQSEESARLEKELQKLKFDDAKVRAERVKKLSSTLTVSIPQVTADVLKFFAEIEAYPEEVKKHVYENARNLADQIADKL